MTAVVSITSASIALHLLTEQAGATATRIALPKTAPASAPSATPSATDASKVVLSREAELEAYGENSIIAALSMPGDRIGITLSPIPTDKAAFRADVIAMMTKLQSVDPAYMKALREGTIVVQTMDEVPELTPAPLVSFTNCRDGYSEGSGIFGAEGFHHVLYTAREKTRGQSSGTINNMQYYAYWPK